MNRCARVVAVLAMGWACSLGAMAQTPRSHAEVDYAARLKEAQASPKALEDAMKTGRRVAGFCANCHGDGGNSSNPDIPNLAGQNPGYLLDQVRQFADGRRKNEFMEGMIRALKPEETIGMVVFFGAQTVLPHRTGTPAAQIARGRELFSKNCFRCHGENGLGSEHFARIAGQQSGYLAKTIKRYREGTSLKRSDPLMASATSQLSDADVNALVAYLSSME